MSSSTRHVVLITYGEPPEAKFGSQLRYSWRILLGLTRSVAPIPVPVLPIIALQRARLRVKLWTDERYSSPLEPITHEQANGLDRALRAREPDTDWRVHVAYEFRDPLLPELLDGVPDDEPLDIVPMYVADSAFTHEISRRTLAEHAAKSARKRSAPLRVLPAVDESEYAEVAAAHVLRECATRGIGGPEWALVLAAHGTLVSPPRPFETGRGATECVAAGIAQRCAGAFGMSQIGWLNHVYGGEWTSPAADVALQRVVEAGFRRVVYFPFGFSADNAESQLEGRIALRTQPGLVSVHLPCVNAAPDYVDLLARSVIAGVA